MNSDQMMAICAGCLAMFAVGCWREMCGVFQELRTRRDAERIFARDRTFEEPVINHGGTENTEGEMDPARRPNPPAMMDALPDLRQRTVCAWCGKHLDGDADAKIVSHGICKPCKSVEEARAITELYHPQMPGDF